MFAVHLMAFYCSKLKEDQIKKVRNCRTERSLIHSLLAELIDTLPTSKKDLRQFIRKGTGTQDQSRAQGRGEEVTLPQAGHYTLS